MKFICGYGGIGSFRPSAACGGCSEGRKGAAVKIVRSEKRANNFGHRKSHAKRGCRTTQTTKYAGMAELADALDSGSNSCKAVQVQVLLPAPSKMALNQ